MTRHLFLAALGAFLVQGIALSQTNAELKEQVRKTEIAFAKTMADRDLGAFSKFLTDDSVFMSGGQPSTGAAAITAAWKPFFDGEKAPFSWEPQIVEVLPSGTLALSSGPVRDPSGKRTGTFNSVWKRQPDGSWKIVLDSGCPVVNCGAPPR